MIGWRVKRLLARATKQRTEGAARLAARREHETLEKALTTPLPAARSPFETVPLLAVDLEMTGLDPRRDRIISIGWVPIDGGRIRLAGAQHRLIDADAAVGASATVHGIVDSDVGDGEPATRVLRDLWIALAGRLPVFHHAPLDQAFLDGASRDALALPWSGPAIDTLALGRRRRERRQQTAPPGALRLGALRAAYGLPPISMHNALSDALATAELLLAMAAGRGLRLHDLL